MRDKVILYDVQLALFFPKVWKVRVQGYEEVCKLFRQQDSEKSPVFSKYVGFIKGFITDANAVAQEKGLDAALCFIENAAVAER